MEGREINLDKLGSTIRFYRQGKGWSLGDLSERAKVPKAYISDLENGAAGKPNIQYVFNIAEALDVTLDDLVREATAKVQKAKRRSTGDLPPGLGELQEDLKFSDEPLSDDDVEMLAQVNFRGNRPKDKEGWRFLHQAIKLAGRQSRQK